MKIILVYHQKTKMKDRTAVSVIIHVCFIFCVGICAGSLYYASNLPYTDVSGRIVDNSQCLSDGTSSEGIVGVMYSYQDLDYWQLVELLGRTNICGDDCCQYLLDTNSEIFVRVKNDEPNEVVALFTYQRQNSGWSVFGSFMLLPAIVTVCALVFDYIDRCGYRVGSEYGSMVYM